LIQRAAELDEARPSNNKNEEEKAPMSKLLADGLIKKTERAKMKS
jgi:hypothetical protein